MSGQVSRGSAGEYQADERAGEIHIHLAHFQTLLSSSLTIFDSIILSTCGGAGVLLSIR